MRHRTLIRILLIMLSMSTVGKAQDKIINLWNGKIPGSKLDQAYKEEIQKTEDGKTRISKVTDPTLGIFLPSKEKANGTAVVICPGGAYTRLSMINEGSTIAQWFNELGITAFVLKYRLPSDIIMENKNIGPLQDVQEAIRFVRRNSAEWKVNPGKIGVIGFSAGGHLAATASTLFNQKVYDSDSTSARPDFSILIYPVISMKSDITHSGSKTNLLGENPSQDLVQHFSNELQVTKFTPPTIIFHSQDDKTVPVENSVNYYSALRLNNVPAELHIFEKGGHGFGLAKNRGTESFWPVICENWLKQLGAF